MKGYLLKKPGDIVYTEMDYPKCPKDWCIVQVRATGICSSDIPRIFKKGMYHMPAVPGHEFSGIIVKVACKKHESYIGKRVGVFPLIPCMKCEQCVQEHYEMCKNYDYIGSRRDGAFAEYVAVPINNIIEIEDDISFKSAAMLEPLAVAMHSVNKICNYQGKRVAVIGTGLIGFAIAQLSILKQAKSVDVVGRSDSKKSIVDRIKGASFVCLDRVDSLYDVIFEVVGSNDSIVKALEISKPGATIVLVGNPAGDISLSQDTYWKILRRQLTLIGTWNSKYNNTYNNDWYEVKDLIGKKKINPEIFVSHVFKQEELHEALKIMKDKTEPYCKIIIEWGE